MPFDCELDSAACIVQSRASGALSDTNLLGHMAQVAALFRQGVIDPSWAQISDFTAVSDAGAVSSEGIRRMAEGNPWPKDSIRAFVVATDEQFGLARMYQTIGGLQTEELCITRSAADAAAHVARERARLGIVI